MLFGLSKIKCAGHRLHCSRGNALSWIFFTFCCSWLISYLFLFWLDVKRRMTGNCLLLNLKENSLLEEITKFVNNLLDFSISQLTPTFTKTQIASSITCSMGLIIWTSTWFFLFFLLNKPSIGYQHCRKGRPLDCRAILPVVVEKSNSLNIDELFQCRPVTIEGTNPYVVRKLMPLFHSDLSSPKFSNVYRNLSIRFQYVTI